MKLLLIDTATSVCSVALVDGSRVLAETLINLPGPSSSYLSRGIEQVMFFAGLCLADLDGFGVTIGPGAFTSLRVGLSTVKGLALATGKPVAALSSLALLAANFPCVSMPVCPLFDARRGEVYAGLYRCESEPEPLRPDCVTAPAVFLASLPERTLFVGDGAVRYQALIEELLGNRACFAPAWSNNPRAVTASILASTMISRGMCSTAATLLPTYLRRSEAEMVRHPALELVLAPQQ